MQAIAFCHVEKSGGSTLVKLLRQAYGIRHCDIIPVHPGAMEVNVDDLILASRLYPRLISVAGHSIRGRHARAGEKFKEFHFYTLLRDPVKRYLSDYYYHVDTLGYEGDFEDWLKREDRKNFITKVFSPTASVDEAVYVLRSCFSLTGFVEHYDDFLAGLEKISGFPFSQIEYSIENVGAKRRMLELDTYTEEIASANASDVKLVNTLREVSSHQGNVILKEDDRVRHISRVPTRVRLRANHLLNRVYRNLVYKPGIGRKIAPHALPDYLHPNKK